MVASAFGSLPCRATLGSTCSTSGRPHATLQTLQHAQREQNIQQHLHRPREAVLAQASRADAAAAAPSGEEQKARLASLGGVVTDAAVPEGHKGLHGFLYGEGGAEEHDTRANLEREAQNWLDEAGTPPPGNGDRALEEVRPYLIADGGNVTVLDVVDGTVMLQLDGACGTCASSTATMKMGIERALRSAFGEALKGVQQVGAQDTSATLASVDAHLDMLRPAISNYGGSIVVRTLQGGVCTVKYDGPPPIAMGIKAAIKDKFPDIKQVEFADS